MAKTERKIWTARGVTEKLEKEFGVSRRTVWLALTFQSDSMTAKLIRKRAITDYGGKPDGVSVASIIKAI